MRKESFLNIEILRSFVFIFLIGLVGCSNVADSSNSNEPVSLVNSNQYPPKVEINAQSQPSNQDFVGCWGGTGGGLLLITESKIINKHTKDSYSYSIKEQKNRGSGIESLLELANTPKRSYIKKFFCIKLIEEDRMAYYGFDSYSDYIAGNFSAAGEFFRGACE